MPENQSAYYSFIKEALLLQKRKKKKLNYSVPCDVIASLMAHILFFFLVLQKYIKNTDQLLGFPGGSAIKDLPANAGDAS